MNELKWFLAVLVVGSQVERQPTFESLVDLQYRLIRAPDADAAHRRALELGVSAHQSYTNAEGEAVTWSFLGLHDLCELADRDLGDGAEVYSRIMHDNPTTFIVPKEKLTVFWADANKHKTARELLDGK